MNSFHFCCVCPQSPSATKEYQQFFESINPSSTANSDEESLQAFLIEKSLKIQPKDFQTLDMNMKSRRPPQLTRSPCFRTPKSNVYTTMASTSQQGSTAVCSPNPDTNGSKLAFSCPQKENNQMTVDSQHIRHYQEASNLQKPPQLPPKIGLLQPPFPYPRKTYPKSSSPIMPSAVASLGFISKHESPLPLRISPIPGSSNPTTSDTDTFVLPSMETSASTSVPPALPPRRRTNTVVSPPPLPPKPTRNSSSSPPPLPPKTYKHKQSSPELPQQDK